MATFYQRGPYQWEAAIRREGFPKERKTFESKRDAQDWAREVERAMRLGQYVPMQGNRIKMRMPLSLTQGIIVYAQWVARGLFTAP